MDMTSARAVPSPTHLAKQFLAYDAECKQALKPLLEGLINRAEAAGWNRGTVASTLMYLAAQHVSPPSASADVS